eukprot:3675577-Prymnesium_polylepis.1
MEPQSGQREFECDRFTVVVLVEVAVLALRHAERRRRPVRLHLPRVPIEAELRPRISRVDGGGSAAAPREPIVEGARNELDVAEALADEARPAHRRSALDVQQGHHVREQRLVVGEAGGRGEDGQLRRVGDKLAHAEAELCRRAEDEEGGLPLERVLVPVGGDDGAREERPRARAEVERVGRRRDADRRDGLVELENRVERLVDRVVGDGHAAALALDVDDDAHRVLVVPLVARRVGGAHVVELTQHREARVELARVGVVPVGVAEAALGGNRLVVTVVVHEGLEAVAVAVVEHTLAVARQVAPRPVDHARVEERARRDVHVVVVDGREAQHRAIGEQRRRQVRGHRER